MVIKEIAFASAQYEEMIHLREGVLRLPLGLKVTGDDINGEDIQIHMAAIQDDGSIVGTILLKPLSQFRVKLRQMAISPALQRRGIGKDPVIFAEDLARTMGFT